MDYYDLILAGQLSGGGGGGNTGYTADEIALHGISGELNITTTTVKTHAFLDCHDVTKVIAKNVTSLEINAFAGCGGAMYFPALTTLNGTQQGMGYNSHYLAMPKLETAVGTDYFRSIRMWVVDLGKTPSIGTRGLYQGSNKTVLIFRKTDGVCSLDGGTGALTLASTCDVYVPASLKSSYQSATGWSSVSAIVWHDLEGSIYESEDWFEHVVS